MYFYNFVQDNPRFNIFSYFQIKMVLSFPNKYTEEEQSLVVSHCKGFHTDLILTSVLKENRFQWKQVHNNTGS